MEYWTSYMTRSVCILFGICLTIPKYKYPLCENLEPFIRVFSISNCLLDCTCNIYFQTASGFVTSMLAAK